jgi:hypothetical protein
MSFANELAKVRTVSRAKNRKKMHFIVCIGWERRKMVVIETAKGFEWL